MRKNFDSQLEMLSSDLITMGALCEEAIYCSSKALLEHDEAQVQKVFETDRQIDEKEREIEGKSMRLLLQQQPVAKDLRTISAALRMISDMERIGDQAQDIANMAEFVKVQEIAHKIHIGEMAEAAIKMVTGSIDSFVKRDLEAAKEVVKSDDIVDNLFLKVKGELPELMQKDAKNAEYYIDLIMIAKYLERIGDHAENIAQWVEYSITGVHEALRQE